jgi:biotin carboxylase
MDHSDMQKKLLVLGGTASSVDIVKVARDMGVYVIVTDDRQEGVAKSIADEVCQISTTDHDGIVQLIKKKRINGVFCGPSEFNLQNCMQICKLADLPFYCTQEQWDICSNKESFKKLCHHFDVPCVPGYAIQENLDQADLSEIEYPVIVKPVDGCSSKGISVCTNEQELREAFPVALAYSDAKRVLVERYIDNDGVGLSARYIICDGEYYLSLVGDRYVVDAKTRQSLIGAAAFFPSKYTGQYIRDIDANVQRMFKSIGVENGTLFMQALVENDKIYFHEMGLRLSGGLTYKMTDSLIGVNDVKMMISYALGEKMCTNEETERISPYLNGKYAGSLSIPLKTGIIGCIRGVEEIRNLTGVEDFTCYYQEGSEITQSMIGTLLQLFGRIKMTVDSKEELVGLIERIHSTLIVSSQSGKDMIFKRFDPANL